MKRWLAKLVVLLLLGAVVNVAVAWGIAIGPIDTGSLPGPDNLGPPHYEQYVSDRHLYLLTSVEILPGEIYLSRMVSESSIYRLNFIPPMIDEADFRALVPTWSRFAAIEPFEEFANHYDADRELVDYDEYASGWPAYSLRFFGSFYYAVPAGSGHVSYDSRMTGLFHFTPPQKIFGRGYGVDLPYWPIWPGFAINTIFYAAILWLLAFGPFTARRIIRHQRGRCIKCGYDLRGAEHEVCPECGS